MAQSSDTFLDRHYFLLRRLHSLSGIVPIGAFLIEHLITNSSIVWGALLGRAEYGHAGIEAFQHDVNFIESLPGLQLLEWGLIFLPIAFHAILGIYFARTGRPNVERYRYQDNWRYVIQRLSGYVGVVYIFMHVTSLRFGWTYGGLLPSFDIHHAASTTALHFQNGATGLFLSVLYLICVSALVFHFANGLWTAAITWGLTITVESQKRWGYVCAAIGLALGSAGIASVLGFSMLDADTARTVELQMLAGQPTAAPDITAAPVSPDH